MISIKITALLVIMGLIATVGISPSYAYWDKTEYPAIQGTIPIENEEFVAKFRKTCISKITMLSDILSISNPIIIVAKDCKRENIWRMELFDK